MRSPFENTSHTIVRRLTYRSLKMNRKRNFFIAIAIMLTTILIAGVFSVGMSLVESVRMEQIRFAGTMAHAAVGHPSSLQIEKLHALDYIKVVGTGNNVGYIKTSEELGEISLTLHYFDKIEWEKLRSPAYTDIVGNYPNKETEIMVPLTVLKQMGIDKPSIGMEIPLSYYTEIENKASLTHETFHLSGWFSNYTFIESAGSANMILVSQALSDKCGKTVEKDGSASLIFVDEVHVKEYCDSLVTDLGLTEDQPVATVQMYNIDDGQEIIVLFSLGIIALFLILTGYLLIYNVLNISVSHDVRFYGLLKTLGVTSKQIRRIVLRQVLYICLIAIPIGIIISLLFSFLIVPFFISELGVVTKNETVVSFSPLIFMGAIVLPLLTAILGAVKPARKAAKISPIAALKYENIESKVMSIHYPVQGKLYRMALRNIFRVKRRAGIVLFSLFLGLTTFLTITTIVYSIDITKYIDSTFESDFVLENRAWSVEKFSDAFIEQVESLPGEESLYKTTWGEMKLDYSDVFSEYISHHPMHEQIATLTEQDISESFKGFILGVDGESIKKYSSIKENSIDIQAFERGEIALIATDSPELFKSVQMLSITPTSSANSIETNTNKMKIPLGGFVPFDYKGVGSGLAPTVIVSNTLMQKWFQDPVILQLSLNVAKGYEQSVLVALKQIIGNDSEVLLTSKIETQNELNHAKMGLLVLGGSISLVMALIGVLNFVNIMSVNIMVRKRELAILRAVGMSSKQIKKMLIDEGLFYAVITLALVFSLGNVIAYAIFKMFQQQVNFAAFNYPILPMGIIALMLLIVCFVIPAKVYRFNFNKTISEQLKSPE